jgi:hypothetical protein
MIEAAIVGRQVFTIRQAGVAQESTLHFAYLLPRGGGSVQLAETLDEHLSQVSRALENPERDREATAAFVRAFVRPRGLDIDATTATADAIEALAALRPEPESEAPLWLAPVRGMLRIAARRSGIWRAAGFPRPQEDVRH